MATTEPTRRVVDAELRAPSSDQGMLEVFRRRYLLRLLVRREIQVRYSGSFLGLLWSYINPLSQFLIFWFVMGIIVGRAFEDVPIHVFSAFIVVYLFTETFGSGTRSIRRNSNLVQRMPMPREMFPVASMLVSLVHVGPQLIILVIACFFFGWEPDAVGIGAAVLALSIVILLGTAMALVFSVANVYFRDVSSVVQILTTFVRFSVPMIYPYTMVAERFRGFVDLYLANPLAEAALLMHRAFWVGGTSDPEHFIESDLPDHLFTRGFIMLGASLVALVLAQLVFTKLDNRIPERLSS